MKTRKTCSLRNVRWTDIECQVGSVLRQMSDFGYQLEEINISVDLSWYDCDLSFFRNTSQKSPREVTVHVDSIACSCMDAEFKRIDRLMSLAGMKRVDQDIDIDCSRASGTLEYEKDSAGISNGTSEKAGNDSAHSIEMNTSSECMFFKNVLAFILAAIFFGVVAFGLFSLARMRNDESKQSVDEKYESLMNSSD